MSEERQLIDGEWLTEAEAIERDRNSEYYGRDELSSAEMRELLVKTREVHAFIKGVAEALNNPMVKAMMPPHMRGMLGD